MIGNNYNKNLKKGQALLITMMLLATVLTVVLAVSFRSTTETQLTKLEEESQKALAAAEAAIEATLQTNTPQTLGSGPLSSFSSTGFTGQTTIDTTYSQSVFITPLLQPDQQYTFYLSTYNPSSPPGLNSGYWANAAGFSVNFGSTTCPNAPALELTFITTSGAIQRRVLDPCNKITGGGAEDATVAGDTLQGNVFFYKSSVGYATSPQYKLVIVRSLFAASKIGFDGNGATLPLQGNYITSQAKSPTGVTKTVRLFQSYPQIPADFFVTSF